ncbi:MAG: hypothetical protein LUG65_03500 [Clostridiales bacterium]|nr:hypothetical protein [Clostridiales bacterium]
MRSGRGDGAMLFFVATVFALLAASLIPTHWKKLSLRADGSILGTVLIGSILWLLYCVWQLLLGVYALITRISQMVFNHRFFLTFLATVLLASSCNLLWQIMTRKNDGFCGNGEISFGAKEAVLRVAISEDQPVGVVRCKNLLEHRCVSEDGQPISAGTRVELVRWFGNKLVVRPLAGAASVA